MSLTELFAGHDRGLVASRFSRFNPNAAGKLLALHRGPELIGAVILRQPKARSPWRDFIGAERAVIAPGAPPMVQRFAFAGDEGARAVRVALEELGPGALCEAWLEHPGDRAILKGLGAAWLGTKVSAYGELRGLFRLGEGKPVRYDLDGAGLARLDLPWNWRAAARELARAAPSFADHYSHYNRRHSWAACALRGYSWDPGFISKPAEMSKAWKQEHPDALHWPLRDTMLMRRFPSVSELLAQLAALGSAAQRVRLMALAPGGGELSRHADITDKEAGTRDGMLLRLHFPIITNAGVRFASWRPSGEKAMAHMAEGSGWFLDTRLPHTAINGGSTRRIHLVIDAEGCRELRARLSWPEKRVGSSPSV